MQDVDNQKINLLEEHRNTLAVHNSGKSESYAKPKAGWWRFGKAKAEPLY